MTSEKNLKRHYDVELQKVLFSINETTLLIKSELDLINQYIEANGLLHNAVIDANKVLITAAKKLKIDVNNVLSNNEGKNALLLNFKVPSAVFEAKIKAICRRA